jgi:hypothetical protein
MTRNSTRNLTRISTRNSTRNAILDAAGLLACLVAGSVLAAGVAGCRIHVDKGANGEDKHVQIDMPFGGIHVNTDETTAADLGLPAYPGAQAVNGDDNHKSADVHMGFGEWEMRVKVVSYSTPDSQDKVTAFYKKALTRYGDVIACQNKAPVGTPTTTTEGLTCSDSGGANVKVDDHGESYGYHSDHSGFELKAGSKRHQHIVAFESSTPGQTRFALIALDLPAGVEGNTGSSD